MNVTSIFDLFAHVNLFWLMVAILIIDGILYLALRTYKLLMELTP